MTDSKVDSSYALPSDPADRKKIKSLLETISAELQMIDDRRATIKDTVDVIHDDFGLPKSVINKLAKTLHKHNYDKVSEESELFKIFYEEVVDKVSVVPAAVSNLDTAD